MLLLVFGAIFIGAEVLSFAQRNWLLLAIAGVVLSYTGIRLVAWRRRRNLRRHQTLGDFLTLTPSAFEEAVAALLRANGFRRVRTVGGAGDLAADITATAPDGQRTIVQCKRFGPGRAVGSRDMQGFLGMTVLHHRARGIFVTTSHYTAAAYDLGRRHGIQLIDGECLVTMAIATTAAQRRSSSGLTRSTGSEGTAPTDRDALGDDVAYP